MTYAATANPAIYTPEAVSAMNRAYSEAYERLQAAGASRDAHVKAGEYIMFLARNGETDQRKLCDLAVQEASSRAR